MLCAIVSSYGCVNGDGENKKERVNVYCASVDLLWRETVEPYIVLM